MYFINLCSVFRASHRLITIIILHFWGARHLALSGMGHGCDELYELRTRFVRVRIRTGEWSELSSKHRRKILTTTLTNIKRETYIYM